MTARDYIFRSLENLVKKFPHMTFAYKCHSLSDTHYVHVCPISEYEKNDNYQSSEGEIVDSFLMLYPNESLAFVSDDSLITVTAPEKVFAASISTI